MAKDGDFVVPEACAHPIDQLVQISDELRDAHRGLWDLAAEGLPRAALVPVDQREVRLKGRSEPAKERRFAETRAAVEQDKRRIGEALAAHHDPLFDAAHAQIARLRDRRRHWAHVAEQVMARISALLVSVSLCVHSKMHVCFASSATQSAASESASMRIWRTTP